ncbi:MAG: hypothetical protein OEZ48_11480 [Candidatus Bathyarchaeota archaeon]|nr:hypothetical protein [Candidatus Bathyarchaeota archaeon]
MPVTSRIFAAAVVLAISCFIIANTMTRSQPVSIVIEDETAVTVHTPVVYQEREVFTVMISSFAAGISAVYIYFEASKKPWVEPEREVPTGKQIAGPSQKLEELEAVSTALRVLQGRRRRVLEVIIGKGGEMLQKDLYLETGFSKAKISRTLKELELRDIIQRKGYGSTKKIILSDWIRKSTATSQEKPGETARAPKDWEGSL